MVSIRSILAASGLYFALSSAAPVEATRTFRLSKRVSDTYKTYFGDGTVAQGWPEMSAWYQSFDQMYRANANVMTTSCSRIHRTIDNSQTEMNDLYNAIRQVASETGVDARYILATVLKESTGCVRAPTTSLGVRNPGLMQSHNGAGTCNENGTVRNPCPQTIILQMIRDGAGGTTSGDGLKQTLTQTGASDVSKYYKSSRIYNSGSIDSSGDLGRGIATHCYSSSIANHLTGWINAPSTCSEETVGNGGVKPTPTPGTTPTPTPTAPKFPGAIASCTKFYTTVSGDFCSKITNANGITLNQFYSWNNGLMTDCSNLWADTQYCIRA